MRRGIQGSVLVMVLIASGVLASMFLYFAHSYQTLTKHMFFYKGFAEVSRSAESATHNAIGQLTVNPKAYLEAGFSTSFAEPGEQVEVLVERRNFDLVEGGYYLVATATKTLGMETFNTSLHTYLQISNVGEYFAASQHDLNIMKGVDLSQARVFGKILGFEMGSVTRVKGAEYLFEVSPPIPWLPTHKSQVIISEPDGVNEPVQLDYPPLFPQVLPSDLLFYQGLAKVDLSDLSQGHHRCEFEGNIFPPGYVGYSVTDSYPLVKHTETNADHVYYCTGDMNVRGTVHGQVLFVADGNIVITGDLMSRDLVTTADNNASAPVGYKLPGAGSDYAIHKDSSTAHQAVLITRKSIWISTTAIVQNYEASGMSWPPSTGLRVYIQAMVLAPNGIITYPDVYGYSTDPSAAVNHLRLDFVGSMVLGGTPQFSYLFRKDNDRKYAHMNTLITHPPPYIPYLTDIHFSFEKKTN